MSMLQLAHMHAEQGDTDSIRAFFAQQDHMQVFHFIAGCLQTKTPVVLAILWHK